jgi:hypothetical protein
MGASRPEPWAKPSDDWVNVGNCQMGRDILSAIYSIESFPLNYEGFRSGPEGTRTPGLRHAKAALSQLSYGPM